MLAAFVLTLPVKITSTFSKMANMICLWFGYPILMGFPTVLAQITNYEDVVYPIASTSFVLDLVSIP